MPHGRVWIYGAAISCKSYAMIQFSGFSDHEMNNPLALCELAARAPNISAGHKVKQAWLQNDRVFILNFHCHALM